MNRRPRRRSPLAVWQRLVCLLIVVLPPLALAWLAGKHVAGRLDQTLRASAPLAQVEASRALGREVRIGRLTPDLSLGRVVGMALHLRQLGTLPVTAENIAVAADPDRPLSAGGEALVSAERASVAVSVPSLLAGDVSGAFPEIRVFRPRALLVRDASGRFNVSDVLRSRTPPRPNQKPFRTQVFVENGALTFRDYAARLPGAARTPATNFFAALHGTADLRGARAVRFSARGAAARGTKTADRLSDPFDVVGAAARGPAPGTPQPAGSPPVTADPAAARLWATLRVRGADAPYWARYLAPLPAQGPQLVAGRVDEARVSLVFPRLPAARVPRFGPPPPPPPALVSGTARISNGQIVQLPRLRPGEALTALAGEVDFDEITLHAAQPLSGRLLGANVTASGDVLDWRDARRRRVNFSLSAPNAPVLRVVDALLPRGRASLPAGVQLLNGTGSVAGTLVGRLTNPVFGGDVRLPGLAYQGQEARNVVLRGVNYANGLLRLGRVSAAVAGGTFTGSGQARVAAAQPDGTIGALGPGQFEADVSGTLAGADLSRLRVAAARRALARLGALRGSGNVDFVASVRNGRLASGGANVRLANVAARGLTIADARARVLVENGRLIVPALVLDSSLGVARIDGRVGANGGLDLALFAAGVDAGKIARVLGAAGSPATRQIGGRVSGLVYAQGRIGGTLSAPRLSARVRVVQPAWGNYRADVVRGDIVATPTQITLGTPSSPVVVRALPATAAISGTIVLPGRTTAPPRLNLVARLAAPVEVSEAVRLVQRFSAAAGAKPGAPAAPNANFDGLLSAASVSVEGTATNPRVRGTGRLRNVVAANGLSVDRGSVRFGYANGRLDATASITRANGRAVASRVDARARLEKSGALSGTFRSDDLDLALLAPLTREFAPLSGNVRVAGNLGGTLRAPAVSAQVLPVSSSSAAPLTLAGVPARASLGRLAYNGAAGRTSARNLVVALGAGADTRLNLDEAIYDARTGRFSARLAAGVGDVNALVSVLRERVVPRLADTQTAGALAERLRTFGGALRGGSLNVASLRVAGRLAREGNASRIADPEVRLDLSGQNLRVAETLVNTLTTRVSLLGDTLTVAEFEARNDAQDTAITLTGRAGLDARTGRIDPDRPLVLQTNNGSLNLLNAFFPGYDLRGRADVTLVATGRTRAPRIEASLDARDVAAGTRTLGRVSAPRIVLAPREGAAEMIEGVALPPGQIEIADRVLLLNGDNRLDVSGQVPFSYAKLSLPRNEPINLSARLPDQDLDPLLDLAGIPAAQNNGAPTTPTARRNAVAARPPRLVITRDAFAGRIAGEVNVRGTLDRRELSGRVALSGGRFTPPRATGQRTDFVNPVRALDAVLSFAGDTVSVDRFTLALGGPNQPGANFGALNLSGTVNIADVQIGRAGDDNNPAGGLRVSGGRANLSAVFDRFRVVESNLLGGGEAVRGELNGTIAIGGTLGQPTLTSARPLTVSGGYFQIPAVEGEGASAPFNPPINPRFALDAVITDRAPLAVSNGGTFRVEAAGTLAARGTLARPDVQGRLAVVRGFLQQVPTVRFTLQRGGQLFVLFRPNQGTTMDPRTGEETAVNGSQITVRDLVANATVYVPADIAANLSQAASGRDPDDAFSTPRLPVAVSPTAGGRTRRYRITAVVNGPLLSSEDGASGNNGSGGAGSRLTLRTTSDPPLSESQIVALIGTQQQLQIAGAGRVQQALSLAFTQTLYSRVVPSLLSSLTDPLASGLGLEEFGLEYNPDAPLTLRLGKRLPPPLTRFLLGYTRTLGANRLLPGEPNPFELSLTYDLGPRLQIGGSLNEQRRYLYFLRGSFSF